MRRKLKTTVFFAGLIANLLVPMLLGLLSVIDLVPQYMLRLYLDYIALFSLAALAWSYHILNSKGLVENTRYDKTLYKVAWTLFAITMTILVLAAIV